MKVSELIKRLNACNPDADVYFSFTSDNTLTGDEVNEVVQITYYESDIEDTLTDVLLRG